MRTSRVFANCAKPPGWSPRGPILLLRSEKRTPRAAIATPLCRGSRRCRRRTSATSKLFLRPESAACNIALDRQGKTPDAQANLRRATELDPDEDDYPFNLGLLALRANEFSAAAGYFRDAAEREPENPDDRALLIQSLEKAGNKAEADQEREAVAEALGPSALPVIRIDAKGDGLARLERIKTELDITALRLEIESPGSAAAANGTAETPGTHIRRGRQELSAGSLDAAEKEFRAALSADPANPSAHRELGEVDRRRGKLDDAVKELQASLEARDSAVVRTMLARIYLDQKKPDLARAEVERAVKLAPNYTEAKKLLEHLQNSKPGGGAQ